MGTEEESDELNVKGWLQRWVDNPAGTNFWIAFWLLMCLMSMLSGAFFSAIWYSNQVIDKVNEVLDDMADNSPCVANALNDYRMNYNLSNIGNNSVSVSIN